MSESLMNIPFHRWKTDKENISKYEITRLVLTTLNERGEASLRGRREILKRIVEFDNFSVCWDSDRLKAKGLVAEIREVINVKDSFTRIKLEREQERRMRLEKEQKGKELLLQKQNTIAEIKKDLYSLFL